jgi:amidohydrolase
MGNGLERHIKMSWILVVVCASVALGNAQTMEKPPELIALDELPQESAQVGAWKQAIEAEIDAYSNRIIEMNDWMYHHPEVGHQEFEASKMLGSELEKQGFEVVFGVEGLDEDFLRALEARVGVDGLPTAFVARYKGKREAPVIAFVVEADALRADQGAFHGCQHNQQGPAGVCGAVALARVMEKNGMPGSVWVVLTPAEEFPPPVKAAMVKVGVFDDVDFVIRSHGTPHQSKRSKAGLGNCCMLIEAASYTFRGRPAHGTRAWYGRDALDAARLFFNAVDMLREHSEPTFRFMGTITKVGEAPNVVNEHVEVDHWIRNADRSGREALRKKSDQVDTIAKGVAMATFTDVDITHYGTMLNGVESAWLQTLSWNYINEYGDAEAISEELGDPSGWDEAGFGGVAVPGVSIVPAVAQIPEVSGHSHENADITISPEGHRGLVQTSKIGAAVALRLVTDPELREKVKNEHAQWLEWGLQEGLITSDMIRKKPATN